MNFPAILDYRGYFFDQNISEKKFWKVLRFEAFLCPGYWKVSWRPTSYPTAPGWQHIKGWIQKVWGDNLTAGSSTGQTQQDKKELIYQNFIYSKSTKKLQLNSSLQIIQEDDTCNFRLVNSAVKPQQCTFSMGS